MVGIDGTCGKGSGILTPACSCSASTAIWTVLRYRNEEYVITNRRVIHAEGVLNKKPTDSSLEKINDAVLTESMFGRMFGFGDLDVLTASESGIEQLRMLRDAKDFKKAMLEAKHELEIELTRPVMPPLRAEPAPVALAGPVRGRPHRPRPAPTGARPRRPRRPPRSTGRHGARRLADLRDRGAITPEEYEAKKAELLARL